jgi:glycosyltransferase involved in cell wall biosynthesis
MDNDLISVVITTYGRTHTLSRAIQSVMHQTYKDLEILIIDDNVKKEYSEQVSQIVQELDDGRLHLIHNENNLGGALSRNVGIKNASSEYVAFLDDDDEYLPDKIDKQYNIFREKNDPLLGLVYCYTKSLEADGTSKLYQHDMIGNCLYEAMLDNIAATSQWMCRKSALIDVGMFDDVPCKQDSNVILKLMLHGYKLDRVNEVLSIYHDEMKTNRISGKKASHEKRIAGEEALRKLCRAGYSHLNKKQIAEVEYSFACRLIEHYRYTDNAKFRKSMLLLLRHPLRRKTLAAFKHTLFNNG